MTDLRSRITVGTRHPFLPLVCSVAAIALLTLLPASSRGLHESPTLFCPLCGDSAVEDALLNILLFVPFGFSLRRLGVPHRRVVVTGFLISATIELLQLGIPGRDTSLTDAIANTIGTGLGAVLCSHWRRILFPSAPRARSLALAATLVWLIVACGTMWSFEPALPARSYFGQWAPVDVYPASFRGSVLSAHVDGIAIPSGRLRNSAAIRVGLGADSSNVRIGASMGAPTEALSSIVSILDDRHREILLMGQQGTSLVFRIRMRASQLRLRNFGIALTTVLADSGRSVSIEASRSSTTQSIRVIGEQGVRIQSVRLTPRLGWTLFAPFAPILGPLSELIACVWLVLMLLPAGYWAARSYSAAPRFAVLITLGAIAIPLLISLLAFGGAVPGARDWLSSALGAAVGWAASGVLRHMTQNSGREFLVHSLQ